MIQWRKIISFHFHHIPKLSIGFNEDIDHSNNNNFFRATLAKIHRIKINHIWTQISYSSLHEAHLKYQRFTFVKKEKNAVKLQKVIFQKSQKLLADNLQERPPRYSEHSIAIHSISKAGYGAVVLAIAVLSSVPRRRAVSVIFEK